MIARAGPRAYCGDGCRRLLPSVWKQRMGVRVSSRVAGPVQRSCVCRSEAGVSGGCECHSHWVGRAACDRRPPFFSCCRPVRTPVGAWAAQGWHGGAHCAFWLWVFCPTPCVVSCSCVPPWSLWIGAEVPEGGCAGGSKGGSWGRAGCPCRVDKTPINAWRRHQPAQQLGVQRSWVPAGCFRLAWLCGGPLAS